MVLSVHEVHDGSVWWNTLAREKVVSEGHRGEQGEREVANVNRQQRNAREVYHLQNKMYCCGDVCYVLTLHVVTFLRLVGKLIDCI